MKVQFDHQTFSLQKYGGISRYFKELIDGINEKPGIQASLALTLSDNVYVRQSAPFTKWTFRGRGSLLYKLNQIYSQRILCEGDFDVFHPTYYDPYFLKKLGNKPFVMTLHDMTHERLSQRFDDLIIDRFTAGKHELSKCAHAIIAVSEFTKRDAVDLLGISPNIIHVVPHGSSFTLTDIAEQYYNQPYLLFVGNRGHYKNFRGLLTAFSELDKSYDLLLVCAGGGPFSNEELHTISSYGLRSRVLHKNFNSDSVLASLYHYAVAFVFPSLYEGFGIPILEAFTCGCPCLLSQSSSLPEVAGNAAVYFNPEDPSSILCAINRIIHDSSLRTSLIGNGYNRVKQYTWQKTVDKTIEVYNSILN